MAETFGEQAPSRRRFLMGFGALGIGLAGCNQKAAVCADPAQLDDQQVSLRASLSYTESAPGKETCADCGFFRMTAGSSCGTCELLKGPANPKGHCDSWNKRQTSQT